jgi:dienelactone hydrolase
VSSNCLRTDQRIDQRAVFESEMREARIDWQMNVYGNTSHSFTNPTAANAKRPNAVRYSPEADRRSWEATRKLFVEAFSFGSSCAMKYQISTKLSDPNRPVKSQD